MDDHLTEEPGAGEEQRARGRAEPADPERVDDARCIDAELEQAEGKRHPAGLVAEEPVVGRHVEDEADGDHHRRELDRPPRSERRARLRRPRETAASGPRAASRGVPSACTTCVNPPKEARAPRTSRRRGCPRPGRPTGRGSRRARASACRRSAPGTVESGSRTIHPPAVSRLCSLDQPGEERVVRESRSESRWRR